MKKKFLDLGEQPIANGFLTEVPENEFLYNLSVGFDEETCLVSHMEYVDPPLMFNENYSYRGSMSQTMQEHFKNFSIKAKNLGLPEETKVLEIGSNDGVFIKNWNPEYSTCVEPCGNFAEETEKMGYITYNEFWNTELALKILKEQGKQNIIFAANCICHIPDLDDAFQAVESLLEDDGLFIFEDPSLIEMISKNSYDQIYDEHPHIFSVIALDNILRKNGLQVVHVENLKVHGGSNRVWASKLDAGPISETVEENKKKEKIMGLHKFETFERWSESVEKSKKDLVSVLNNLKENGENIISYGATSKSTTVFNYCDIGPNLIDYISDTTPEKQGKLSPGKHIPIKEIDKIPDDVNYVYLGAWNFLNEIKQKEFEFVNRGGKFITHVPTVKFE